MINSGCHMDGLPGGSARVARLVRVFELQLVQAGHRSTILAFEVENRDYFAASISDRGDEYFAQFTERHNGLLAEQEAGTTASYVLVEEDGTVVGRFNLYRIHDGTAEVGYRIRRTNSWPRHRDRSRAETMPARNSRARPIHTHNRQ